MLLLMGVHICVGSKSFAEASEYLLYGSCWHLRIVVLNPQQKIDCSQMPLLIQCTFVAYHFAIFSFSSQFHETREMLRTFRV